MEKDKLAKTTQTRTDYDTQWKEIISNLFEDFIEFFLPEAYPLVDFNQPVEFLEQELHKIVANNKKKGNVVNDKLVKVKLKDGTEKWILIHIEVQSTFEKEFAKRMFVYFYRIFDKYSQQITALAIYTNPEIPKQYGKYEYNFLGTKNVYEFNTYLVKKAKERELQQSNNPFALVILASKYLHKSASDNEKRLSFKRKLIRLAKEKNYSKEQIIHLLKFIHLILHLPKDLNDKFVREVISEFVKEDNMQTLKSQEFSNQLHKALYGETWTTRARRIKKEAKAEAKKEAEAQIAKALKEAKESKEKALKEAKESKENEMKKTQTDAIQRLLLSKKLSIEEIAQIMNVETKFVKSIQKKL